eukprot:SM000303S11793  [mRNA]  locus=s303:31882:35299:- [translate_table: standard]
MKPRQWPRLHFQSLLFTTVARLLDKSGSHRVQLLLQMRANLFLHSGCDQALAFTAGATLSSGSGGGEGLRILETTDPAAETGSRTATVDEGLPEQAGCVLWDLASSDDHAAFLIGNQILDVVLAVLKSDCSYRLREISLGILGNLACHPSSATAFAKNADILQLVVEQLHVDDPPCLTETCRLLSAGLRSAEAGPWVSKLNQDGALGRVLWIIANTNQSQLVEKCAELLMAMVDGKHKAHVTLLQPLLDFGIVENLTDLLNSEVISSLNGSPRDGTLNIDTILGVLEGLSVLDLSAPRVAENDKLLDTLLQILHCSDNHEIGPSAVGAAVLLANFLADRPDVKSKLRWDALLLDKLLIVLPGCGADMGARSAIWSILGVLAQEYIRALTEHPRDSKLEDLARTVAESLDMLKEELDTHRDDITERDQKIDSAGGAHAEGDDVRSQLVTCANGRVNKVLADLEETSWWRLR